MVISSVHNRRLKNVSDIGTVSAIKIENRKVITEKRRLIDIERERERDRQTSRHT